MSLTPCLHDGRQRPADVTCGERCERFPKCVPSASPNLKALIGDLLQAGRVERETIEELLARLEAAQMGNSTSVDPPEG
jgi:hypothetical protein